MIFTLAWKELREHRSIWVAMVLMTFIMGCGMARLVPPGNPMSISIPELIVLGLAVTYGVVCGGMMLAGEHENGTLAFLDIFHGRRGSLWGNKFVVGIVLVVTEALAVAGILWYVDQAAPTWVRNMLGSLVRQPGNLGRLQRDAAIWFVALPLVTLEAYAWGLLGSSLTQRVLAGAGIALGGLVPMWLVTLCTMSDFALTIRLVAMLVVLAVSCTAFVQQARDVAPGALPLPPLPLDLNPRSRDDDDLDEWSRADENDEFLKRRRRPAPAPRTPPPPTPEETRAARRAADLVASLSADPDDPTAIIQAELIDAGGAPAEMRTSAPSAAPVDAERDARSPGEALWWLTWRQAAPLLPVILFVSLAVGMVLPATAQILWPMATLLLGATCGCMVFAQEQRDLSYQFLASQHLPLKSIWRTKLLLWAGIALGTALVTLLVFAGTYALLTAPRLARADEPPAGFGVPLCAQMGPALFFGVWVVYGFCLGQSFVWFFRKTVLAILMTFLTAGAAIMLWMPPIMCGGMSGWQVWLPPLVMLVAGWRIVRTWAGGSIYERRAVATYAAFGGLTLAWACVCFTYRAWEIPDVDPPMNLLDFKAMVQADANPSGKIYQKAMNQFDEKDALAGPWLKLMTEAAALPPGMLELPRADGQRPPTTNLARCPAMIAAMETLARRSPPDQAVLRLGELLAFSRTLRNRQPIESYLVGVLAEAAALDGLHEVASRGPASAPLFRSILDVLDRHAQLTPPPVECLRTECYISSGIVKNPNVWDYPGGDRLTVGAVALSLELPSEAERKTRLWQLVWDGMFRSLDTPAWQRPAAPTPMRIEKNATRALLDGWIPADDGPGAAATSPRVARWFDDSWLANERLFIPVSKLNSAATRSKCRVDSMRLAVATCFYRFENGTLRRLDDLVPRYLPSLPKDPYSGEGFRYAPDEQNPVVRPAKLWSTGPDRTDDGGRADGSAFPDDNPRWTQGGLDLITTIPQPR